MRQPIRLLASLRLNVALLLLLAGLLGAGTILEARQGTPVAQSYYHSPWIWGPLALLGLNLACSIWERRPWTRLKVGFLLTHGSLLLILTGGLVTHLFRVEGRMELWEGQESEEFVHAERPGEIERHRLPFSVRLERFAIDFHPGTSQPAAYRSLVTVTPAGEASPLQAEIRINDELSLAGYRLFQTSYRSDGERRMSVLTVSRDPGRPFVFAGFALLLAGMIAVPLLRARAARLALLLLLPAIGGGAPATADSGVPDLTNDQLERLRRLAVLHDGRVMPLDTLAREAVWRVTGSESWRGFDPVALVLGWSFFPAHWAGETLILVDEPVLAAELGLERRQPLASFDEIAGSPTLLDLIRRSRAENRTEPSRRALLEGADRLENRLAWLRRFFSREILRVVPGQPADAGSWNVPDGLREPADLLRFSGAEDAARLEREIGYNRLRPFRIAWWVLAATTALCLPGVRRPGRWLPIMAATGGGLALAAATWGLATRWSIAGRIPATSMYESLLFLGSGVALAALLGAATRRPPVAVTSALGLAALAFALADLLPLDPFLHPPPPPLLGTPWLAIHVPIIMLGYAVLTLAMLAAHLQVGGRIFRPAGGLAEEKIDRLLYTAIQIGSILLVAGILTGSVWASSSWGRYWGWDPKEVWSLIAFLAYMAILHARADRLIGPFGSAVAAIVAYWAILATYVGVNFILSTGLHSYGFGESGVTRWALALLLGEALFLLLGLLRRENPHPTVLD